jgi:hypothetical protein
VKELKMKIKAKRTKMPTPEQLADDEHQREAFAYAMKCAEEIPDSTEDLYAEYRHSRPVAAGAAAPLETPRSSSPSSSDDARYPDLEPIMAAICEAEAAKEAAESAKTDEDPESPFPSR